MNKDFFEVYGNQGVQAMSYQQIGDQMPIVQKYSSDDEFHDSSLTPKRVQGHRFGTFQGQPVIAQRYSNVSQSGKVIPHVIVQDMMVDRPQQLLLDDAVPNRNKRFKKVRTNKKSRSKPQNVEVIAEADETNIPQILKFIEMLKQRTDLHHPRKNKGLQLDIKDLDDPIPEKSKKKKKKKKKDKSTKAKINKKSKRQKFKALKD